VLSRYLPDENVDHLHDVRVVLVKDESGRRDKVVLYDSHGDDTHFHRGQSSPLPRRVLSTILGGADVDGQRVGGDYRVHVRGHSPVVQGDNYENALDSIIKSPSCD
jgi:hypothetical protein